MAANDEAGSNTAKQPATAKQNSLAEAQLTLLARRDQRIGPGLAHAGGNIIVTRTNRAGAAVLAARLIQDVQGEDRWVVPANGQFGKLGRGKDVLSESPLDRPS